MHTIMNFLERLGKRHEAKPVPKKTNGHVPEYRPKVLDYVRTKEHPVPIHVGEGILNIMGNLSPEERADPKYALQQVEVGSEYGDQIDQGTYFETGFTPDEWNKNSTKRLAMVGGTIFQAFQNAGRLQEGDRIEITPVYEKNGNVVAKAEVRIPKRP